MTDHWRPRTLSKELRTQVAFDDERIRFRFEWDQPDAGGWLHDMLVYRDGRWERFADPSPWVVGGDTGEYRGFYEDRLSFLLDDGSVTGFEEFGGWLTAHAGMRSMPDQVSAEEVRSHGHFGPDGLDKTDVRKFIPQACAGEWWENDWRRMRPQAELDRLKDDGVFLDLPMWRAHRSDPTGYGTDHHVLDYRHTDQGRNTYGTQEWDPENGPEYMWDPNVVPDGALDYHAVRGGEIPAQGEDTYALHEDDAVAFDPDVAEWEGAMIPRRPLREPHGSAADWTANGTWDDGVWTVEMSRDLRIDHPADTKQLEPGGVYTWTPAVHHGAGTRWHWVAYPYKLGLGVEPDYVGDEYASDTATLVAEDVERVGGGLDWDAVRTYSIPLIFPGVLDWTDLTSDDHPRSAEIRNAEITMWELYEKDPSSFLG